MLAIGSIGGMIGSVIGPVIQKRFSFGAIIISTIWLSALSLPFFLIAPNVFWLGVVAAVSWLSGPMYQVVQYSY